MLRGERMYLCPRRPCFLAPRSSQAHAEWGFSLYLLPKPCCWGID